MPNTLRLSTTPLRRCCLWLLPALLAFGSGCAGSSRQVVRNELLLPFTSEQLEAIDKAEAAPYLLQRGDLFSVETMIDEELRQLNVLVLPDGTATLVHLGNMPVAGLSLAQLEDMLNAAYSRDFRDVHLNVVLQKVAGRQVYVLGEVQNPGLYDVGPQGLGIMGAIAQAGGFTEWSGQASVVLLRLTPAGYLSREFDITALRKGRTFDAAVLDLQPYDVIYVNRSKIGDFAAFSKNVMGSLVQYSRFVLDVRGLEDPELYRR